MFEPMAVEANSVAISFVVLLEDICTLLSIGAPQYNRSGKNDGCVSVTVDMQGNLPNRTFFAFGEPTISACYEVAARRMTVFLVRQYKVVVYDVNIDLRICNEQCAQLFGFKYDSMFRIENNIPPARGYEIEPIEGLDWGRYRIEIDFLSLLKDAVQRFNISVTPMRTFLVSPGVFVSWFSIPVPGSNSPKHAIMGFKATTVDAAKQTLAKKTLNLLSIWYRFEVQDVNYYLLPFSSYLMDAEEGVYEHIRQRVLGLAPSGEPVPVIVEEDCITPRGSQNKIPQLLDPPPPPTQRRGQNHVGTSSSAVKDCASPDAFSL